MPPFNWFDIVLVFILLGSIFSGLRAGFARVVVGLITAILGLLVGFWCYRLLAIQLMPFVNNNVDVANLLGFLGIFLGVLLLGSFVATLLSKLFQWVGLSWFNHLLGGFAGVVRGVLIVTVLVDVLIAFTPTPPPIFLSESRVLPYTNQFSEWLIDLAPRELQNSFEQQMNAIRQFWFPQRKRDHSTEV